MGQGLVFPPCGKRQPHRKKQKTSSAQSTPVPPTGIRSTPLDPLEERCHFPPVGWPVGVPQWWRRRNRAVRERLPGAQTAQPPAEEAARAALLPPQGDEDTAAGTSDVTRVGVTLQALLSCQTVQVEPGLPGRWTQALPQEAWEVLSTDSPLPWLTAGEGEGETPWP